MPFEGVLTWVWIGTVLILIPCGILVLLLVSELRRPKPIRSVQLGDMTVELRVQERKLPCRAEAIIVPVAPDLKMVAGIAKWVRDSTADVLQREADKVAPLPPGEAFIGSGGRYRFQVAALAVVMDEQKRTTPEWIAAGISRALRLAREKEAQTCLLPDMTEDLIRQPQWITDEQRRETCAPIARAMIDGLRDASDTMNLVIIWVWRKGMEDIFLKELERVEAAGGQELPTKVAMDAAV